MPSRPRSAIYLCFVAAILLLATLSACASKQAVSTAQVVAPEAVKPRETKAPTKVVVKEVEATQEVEKVVTQLVEATQVMVQPTEAPAETQPAALPAPTNTAAPAIQPTVPPAPTPIAQATKPPKPTALPTETSSPQPAVIPTEPPPSQPTAQEPTPLPEILPTPPPSEKRTVELEWPARLRLGDSDTVRLALIPSETGYNVTTEFPDHTTITQTVMVQRPSGYELFAGASLNGVGFNLSPVGEQERQLPVGETVTWRWSLTPRSPGQHRISVIILLRWKPLEGAEGATHESEAYSRSLNINVVSFFGLTRGQAMTSGLFGLLFGSSLSLFALAYSPQPRRTNLQTRSPNERLGIESKPGIEILPYEQSLLRALFNRYGRISIESEFLSGYSGARTFLALPVRSDGRADAYTIIKIGDRESIHREYDNYEAYVKDTLPPITARIQHAPVVLPGIARGSAHQSQDRAAVQYTFIGAPGQTPLSLRQALLADPDPSLLDKLFETFGPNWWMQRHPYTFRLAQEYDRMLPAHYVISPEAGRGGVIDGRQSPAQTNLAVGDRVSLRGFTHIERRADGKSLSLRGEATPGQPPLRARWLGLSDPNGATGRVVATRRTLLRGFVNDLDLFGLPDPLEKLASLLDERLSGTQSTIHGDLNLENILVGPGGFGPQGFVWLIDFAQTRDGHPLFDFAHLEAEIIAHIIASQITDPTEYLHMMQSQEDAGRNRFYTLRHTLHAIASRCLFNPTQPREYDLALYMACLGALKFSNLDSHARHLLYLTAAYLG
jgi:hypothetical protein